MLWTEKERRKDGKRSQTIFCGLVLTTTWAVDWFFFDSWFVLTKTVPFCCKWQVTYFFKSILKSGMRRLGANCVPSNRSFLDGQKHIDQGIFSFSFSTSYSWVYLIVYLEFPILQWVLMLMAATVGKIIQVFVVLFIFVLFSCMCRVWCKVWCLCFITRVWSHCQCSYDGCSYKMTTSYF